jgi:hypothetical protein
MSLNSRMLSNMVGGEILSTEPHSDNFGELDRYNHNIEFFGVSLYKTIV